MKINKLVCAIIIFIIALVLGYLFILPQYTLLHAQQDMLAQKQVEYDGKYSYYKKVSEILKKIKSKKDSLDKIDSALPSDFYLASLVYFFQTKAAEAGLKVKSLTLLQISLPTGEGAVRDVTFSVHVSGDYRGFRSFISTLDTSARLFDINSVSFVSPVASKGQVSSNPYEFNMEIETHTY